MSGISNTDKLRKDQIKSFPGLFLFLLTTIAFSSSGQVYSAFNQNTNPASARSRSGPVACDTTGNWFLLSNYDGGNLNIIIDQNVPNLKVAICTYEPVNVTISGAFVSNVVDVFYAGLNSSQNNNNCGFPISTSSFSGVNPAIVTVQVAPPVTIISPPNPANILSLPNGYNGGIITAASCDTSTWQGGGNTIDQVVDYFQQQLGGALRGLRVQYCCWLDTDFYRLSEITGNCCNPSSTGFASVSYPAGPFCIGNGSVSPTLIGDSSGTFVSTPAGLSVNAASGVIDLNTSSPGTYTVTYSIAANCQPNVYTNTIVINPGSSIPPEFSFPNTLCQGAGAQAPQPLAGFVPGGTFVSVPAGLPINPLTGVINLNTALPGNYSVSYTSPPGACGGNLSFTFPNLTILSSQIPYSIVASDSCISNPLNVQLSGTAGVVAIQWNMGNPGGATTNIVTGNTNSHLYSQPGTYTITAIVQGLCGNDTIQRIIQIIPQTQPVLGFSFPNDPCNLSNRAPSLNSGFSLGGQFSTSPSLPINTNTGVLGNLSGITGQFVVTYTYPAQACIAGGSSSFTINVKDSGNVIVVSPVQVSIAPGDSVQLVAEGALTYSWEPSAGLSCTGCPSPFASPSETTLYSVFGNDAEGCPSAASVLVIIDIICNEVFVPDIFSPNGVGDLRNETLCVYSNCIKSMNLAIYNRWGELVFNSTSSSDCWDGSHKGTQAMPGVYTYRLFVDQQDGKRVEQTGTITLQR